MTRSNTTPVTRFQSKTPTVNFHLICAKCRLQIKRARAYPGRGRGAPAGGGGAAQGEIPKEAARQKGEAGVY